MYRCVCVIYTVLGWMLLYTPKHVFVVKARMDFGDRESPHFAFSSTFKCYHETLHTLLGWLSAAGCISLHAFMMWKLTIWAFCRCFCSRSHKIVFGSYFGEFLSAMGPNSLIPFLAVSSATWSHVGHALPSAVARQQPSSWKMDRRATWSEIAWHRHLFGSGELRQTATGPEATRDTHSSKHVQYRYTQLSGLYCRQGDTFSFAENAGWRGRDALIHQATGCHVRICGSVYFQIWHDK